MRIHEFLTESFPYPPGTEMPANVIDLRDPGHAKGRYFYHSKKFKDQRSYRPRSWTKMPTTCVVLTKSGGILVYYYGDHNVIPWPEVLDRVQVEMDKTLQTDSQGIVCLRTGYLIDRSRATGNWGGDRNSYSTDVADTARALLARGIATASTPIWIGNWAAHKGEHIGTIGKIIANSEDVKRLVLYHGTDTLRLARIMKVGLAPLSFEDRVWNSSSLDRKRPEHREDSVYLTASRPQAEYYAKKAVNIDRARFGPSKRSELRRIINNSDSSIRHMSAALERYRQMSSEQIAAEDEHATKYDYRADRIASKLAYYPDAIAKAQQMMARAKALEAHEYFGKIEPVILQITLNKSEFDKLMADDDHLRQNPTDKPEDWQKSLSHFGQIAFRGSISPERIKVITTGAAASRKSH